MSTYLTRELGIPEVPMWAGVGGSTFHELVRRFELGRLDHFTRTPDEMAGAWKSAFAEETVAQLERSGVPLADWYAAKGGRENRDWWLDKGPEMIAQYAQRQTDRETTIARLPGGAAALEVEVNLSLPGVTVPVNGFIDQIRLHPRTGDLEIVDLKTGSYYSGDAFQLRTYALAADRTLGITGGRWWGRYYRARQPADGQPDAIAFDDMDEIEAEVAYRAAAARVGRERSLFPAIPNMMCGACGVRKFCPAKGEAPHRLSYRDIPRDTEVDSSLTSAYAGIAAVTAPDTGGILNTSDTPIYEQTAEATATQPEPPAPVDTPAKTDTSADWDAVPDTGNGVEDGTDADGDAEPLPAADGE